MEKQDKSAADSVSASESVYDAQYTAVNSTAGKKRLDNHNKKTINLILSYESSVILA